MEKIKKICKLEYAFMAYNLVFVLYMLVAIPIEVILTGKYALLVFLGSLLVTALACFSCWQNKQKPSLLQYIAFGFYLWLAVCVGYHFNTVGADNIPHLLLLFCLIFPCFLGFSTFTQKATTLQWKVLAVGYNSIVTLISAVGIYCSYADVRLNFNAIGYKYIIFMDLKLYILSHYNTTGHFVSLAMLFALGMIFITKRTWVRVLFLLDFAVLYVTLGLTYSRTCELTICACAAIAVCYYIWHAKPFCTTRLTLKNIALRLAACGASFLLIVAVGYSGMTAVNTQFQARRVALRATETHQELILDVISAQEETAPTTMVMQAISTTQTTATAQTLSVANQNTFLPLTSTDDTQADSTTLEDSRSLSDLSTMAVRLVYWSESIAYFASHPIMWAFGASPAGVATVLVDAITEANPPHTHNAFVQVLMATGAPGFILFAALWGISLFWAVKFFFTRRFGFAGDCMPLLLILAFTAMGMQENILFSSESTPMLAALFFGCAAIANFAQRNQSL